MRTSRIELRLTDEERELDTAAAEATGESLSEFFRQAARERAAVVLSEQRRIKLADEEARRFLAALDRPDRETVRRLRALRDRPSAFADE